MPETRDVPERILDAAQAAELALLLDLEARWENLRTDRSQAPEVPSTTQDLHGKQRAYEAFREKLRGYNQRFTPAHVPEVLLNTPARLQTWCRKMRELYRLVEGNPRVRCPVHLLEKAYRCADRLAFKLGKAPFGPRPVPDTVPAALLGLEALDGWCDSLARAA